MLNRLLGIVYILMRREMVTAAQLAERFEVSVRTIYRDVETLSMAGIPVYTRKGKNGGICLMEQFVLDKLLISAEEQQQILAALTGLEETGAQQETETLRKLSDFFRREPVNWVSIDLSDWSGRRQALFEQLKQAVLEHRVIRFDYFGQSGEVRRRTVEPLQLVFREYTWYLLAFCREKQAERLFKILRMKRVETLEETFRREAPAYRWEEKTEASGVWKTDDGRPLVRIELLIDGSEAYRIYDRFEEEEVTVLENGDFRISAVFALDDWVYGLLLSFGPALRVLGPPEVKEEYRHRVARMLEHCGENRE